MEGSLGAVIEGLRSIVKRNREEAALDQMLRHQVLASLVNPAPDVPAADVFAHLRAHHDEQLKAKRRGT